MANPESGYTQSFKKVVIVGDGVSSPLQVRTGKPASGASVLPMALEVADGGVVTLAKAPLFTPMTLGSILFAGTDGALTQDNANLFWDDTNNTVGFGTTRTGAISSTNPLLRVKGTGTTSATSALEVQDSAAAVTLFVRNDGRVGIGTVTPASKLDIQDAAAANDATTEIFRFGGGTDAVLGPIAMIFKARPSAVGANRYIEINVGDNSANRPITIAPSVKFGVGTTNPAGLFTVGYGSSSQFQVVAAGTVAQYNNIATVSGGVPAEYATVDLTAQGAAIAATTTYAVPATGAGMYRISFVAKVTQVATTSSTLGGANGFQVLYTDKDDAVVVTTPATHPYNSTTTNLALNTTQAVYSGEIIVNAKESTNI